MTLKERQPQNINSGICQQPLIGSQDYRKYTIPTDIRGKVFPKDLLGKVFPTEVCGKVFPKDLCGKVFKQTLGGMFCYQGIPTLGLWKTLNKSLHIIYYISSTSTMK